VTQINFQELSISSIRHRCAQESDRFFNKKDQDPRYCYELFRRALFERDDLAWNYIYYQYERLVRSWVRKHPSFPITGEEVDYFVNEAYSKLWTAVEPEKFTKFPNLKSILGYLQTCVWAVIVDFVRLKEFKLVVIAAEDIPHQLETEEPELEEKVSDKLNLQAILDLIDGEIKDERENCVFYGSFIKGLKPGEIIDHCKGLFEDVKEVYRVKENLLARLRRNDDLKKFLGDA
jgi:DNA-directed RNA polymerase specialized sigma24 family protein